MADPSESEPNGFHLDAKNRTLSARGISAALLICTVAVVAVVLFASWRLEQVHREGMTQMTALLSAEFSRDRENELRASHEHRELKRAQEIVACINTYDFPERKRLRERWERGSWSIWCPWINGDAS